MAETRHRFEALGDVNGGWVRHFAFLRPFFDYRRLAWLWVRAAAQYPLSLILMSLAVTVGVFTEVGAVVIVFGHAGTLAGFTVYEGLLVFGPAASAFGIADMFAGSVDRLGQHVRTGSFDAMLIRPVTYVVPLAFISWQPALFVLDRPDPLGMPEYLRYAGPVIAVLLCACAALTWRVGLRHYRSTGS